MELYQKTAHELAELLRQREISSVDITRSVMRRVNDVEPQVQAYVTVMGEVALEMAEEADKGFASGGAMAPLAGIPVALKDNMCSRGHLTTCSSRILANFVPPYDATVVRRLRDASAVFLRQDEHGCICHGIIHGELGD